MNKGDQVICIKVPKNFVKYNLMEEYTILAINKKTGIILIDGKAAGRVLCDRSHFITMNELRIDKINAIMDEVKNGDSVYYIGDFRGSITYMKSYEVVSIRNDGVISVKVDNNSYYNLLREEYITEAQKRIRYLDKLINE